LPAVIYPERSFAEAHDSAMQMPLPGLFADLDVASASVALPDEFLASPASVQVEVLQQWQRDIERYRRSAIAKMFRDFAALRPELDLIEQLESFRHACEHLGLDCPRDLPLLLQSC